jgi:hypothetical protein
MPPGTTGHALALARPWAEGQPSGGTQFPTPAGAFCRIAGTEVPQDMIRAAPGRADPSAVAREAVSLSSRGVSDRWRDECSHTGTR